MRLVDDHQSPPRRLGDERRGDDAVVREDRGVELELAPLRDQRRGNDQVDVAAHAPCDLSGDERLPESRLVRQHDAAERVDDHERAVDGVELVFSEQGGDR